MAKKFGNANFHGGIDKPRTGDSFVDIDKGTLEEQMLLRFKLDTEYRKKFSEWVIYIIPIWLGLVLIVFILHGLRILRFDSSEIIALLATTTANVLGLAFIVLKGFFGDKK